MINKNKINEETKNVQWRVQGREKNSMGELYITESHICFKARSSFGFQTKVQSLLPPPPSSLSSLLSLLLFLPTLLNFLFIINI